MGYTDTLNRHRGIHTGDRPHKCPRCDKRFSDKSSLNRHLKAHDKRVAERTFICATCNETFHNLAPFNAYICTTHQPSQPATTSRKRTAKKTSDAPPAKKTKTSSVPVSISPPSAVHEASAAAAGSSWQEDPAVIPTNLVPTGKDIARIFRQHWSQIRTCFGRQNSLQDWYNFRLSTISPAALCEQLIRIFADHPSVFKVNFSFGFILQNTESGALQYHHPSANNNLVLEQPFLVSNSKDLERLYQQMAYFLEWVREQRTNSKWVHLVKDVTWFV